RRVGQRTAPTGPVSRRRPQIVTNPTRQRGSDPRRSAPALPLPSLARRVGQRTAPTGPGSMRQSRGTVPIQGNWGEVADEIPPRYPLDVYRDSYDRSWSFLRLDRAWFLPYRRIDPYKIERSRHFFA